MVLEYILPNEKLLLIHEEVLITFYNQRQTKFSFFESGGILLGRVFEDYIFIDKATIPGEGDKRGPLFFHRSKARAQLITNRAFLRSKGKQIYIGEWHTHREKEPHPSFIDKFEIRRAFHKSKLNLNFLILIIVGNDDALGNIWTGYVDENGIKVF